MVNVKISIKERKHGGDWGGEEEVVSDNALSMASALIAARANRNKARDTVYGVFVADSMMEYLICAAELGSCGVRFIDCASLRQELDDTRNHSMPRKEV